MNGYTHTPTISETTSETCNCGAWKWKGRAHSFGCPAKAKFRRLEQIGDDDLQTLVELQLFLRDVQFDIEGELPPLDEVAESAQEAAAQIQHFRTVINELLQAAREAGFKEDL